MRGFHFYKMEIEIVNKRCVTSFMSALFRLGGEFFEHGQRFHGWWCNRMSSFTTQGYCSGNSICIDGNVSLFCFMVRIVLYYGGVFLRHLDYAFWVLLLLAGGSILGIGLFIA